MENGYKLGGVRYNIENERAEYYISSDKIQMLETSGSKYLPPFTEAFLNQIDVNDRYIIIGTPCFIASLRRYIRFKKREDNFILIDFFCHGVPSLKFWDKYIGRIRKRIGDFNYVSFRNKLTPKNADRNLFSEEKTCGDYSWSSSTHVIIKGQKGVYENFHTKGDLFFKAFLGDYIHNEPCYTSCSFKQTNSSADIRIGDFWGYDKEGHEKGVSGVLCYTERGKELLEQSNITLKPISRDLILKGQLNENPPKQRIQRLVKYLTKSDIDNIGVIQFIISSDLLVRRTFSLVKKPRYVLNAIKRRLK